MVLECLLLIEYSTTTLYIWPKFSYRLIIHNCYYFLEQCFTSRVTIQSAAWCDFMNLSKKKAELRTFICICKEKLACWESNSVSMRSTVLDLLIVFPIIYMHRPNIGFTILQKLLHKLIQICKITIVYDFNWPHQATRTMPSKPWVWNDHRPSCLSACYVVAAVVVVQ